MMLPSIGTCMELMKRYGMFENIKTHSFVVARGAHLIARNLTKSGCQISIEKATIGALLHDIGKTIALQSGGDHAEIGKRICLENGMEDLADIVGEHVRLKQRGNDGRFSETEVVYYADKRVNHDRIVTLDERLSYILERYGQNNPMIRERIRDNFRLCKEVELKLFRFLDFTPEMFGVLAGREEVALFNAERPDKEAMTRGKSPEMVV
jgi:putative nucleotidyltransferase with HDIG domain